MSHDVLTPLTGSSPRLANKAELDVFLTLPDAASIVRSTSFEQVFFTIRTIGLADATGILPHVSEAQVRGFVDLDCWRKDHFVSRPFMEWIAAFVQAGPAETARALGGIDEDVTALYLKDLIDVYEVERDEPPPATELMFTPDGMLAIRQRGEGEKASIAALILDALFRFDPDLGFRILRRVRYSTRMELEETAYQNKVRRLDVHGFVDYFEALSIYAEPSDSETFGTPSPVADDAGLVSGDVPPQPLPTVFADSLAGDGFLMTALDSLSGSDTERIADELTALGNRILSANLVNLGEVGSIHASLREMKDFLTIGLECLSEGQPDVAAGVLAGHHVQTVFRKGFGEVVRLRASAGRLIRIPNFRPELLESPDVEFLSGVVRAKPLLWTGAIFRNFQSLDEVRDAGRRIETLTVVVGGYLELFGKAVPTLRQTFNTAVIRQAISGVFEPLPIRLSELEAFLEDGCELPWPPVPERLAPFAESWIGELRDTLQPLVGQKIDPRFIDTIHMRP